MRQLACLGAIGATFLAVGSAWAADVNADPNNYQQQFATLQPGDRLLLAAGDYTGGLRIDSVEGADGMPIVIEGPAMGTPARFVGRPGANTIDLENAAYITIRNILFDGNGEAVDAIKAGGGGSSWTHHITIEGCTIINHTAGLTNQQLVGISTKIVSWDWVVTSNVIGDPSGNANSAGTGMYFGNSTGDAAFIGGLIQGNLVIDTLGYSMQVKRQNAREQAPGVPTGARTTIIRHNVFIKSDNPSPDGGRPNLYVGGFPDSGAGSDDHYEIYGNFFFHNSEDHLLQASGRLHIHDNIFIDVANSAIRLNNFNSKPVIDALVYNNTIYSADRGINIVDAPTGTAFIAANAVFATTPLSGVANDIANITDTVANAGNFVNNPSLTLGAMDFYPIVGSALAGGAVDLGPASADADYDRDFNGDPKNFTFRGAYHGEGTNPGWVLDAAPKDMLPGGFGGGSGVGGSGGNSGSGGASSGSGASNGSGAGGPAAGGASSDDGDCGCELVGAPTGSGAGFGALMLLGLLIRRRNA